MVFMDDNKGNFEADLREAVRNYYSGVDGDKAAVRKAFSLLKALYEKNPGNYTVEAYLGCALALLARDVPSTSDKMKFATEGLKFLDHAVSKSPDDMQLRMLRANVCNKLPERYFHRTDIAIEDFERLASHYESNGSGIDKEQYCKILYDLGCAYKTVKRSDERSRVWNKLKSVDEAGKYAQLINADKPKDGAKPPDKFDMKAVKMYRKAAKGDRDAVNKALSLFEKLYAQNPEDPLVSAYYSDCLCLSGRYAGNPGALFEKGMKAVKILDEAVEKDPDNIEIRLIRGLQSYLLPEPFFKRTSTAIADFEYLTERYEKDGRVFRQELYHKFLQFLKRCYERLDKEDELKAVRVKLNEAPGEDYGKTGADKEDGKATLEKGIRLYDQGLEGDKKALKKALDILRQVYEANPQNTTAEAYYGSALALLSRGAVDAASMFSNAAKGMQHVRHAVSHDPDNKELRMLRAYLLYNLPEEFFHQTKNSGEDLKYLLNAYEADHSMFPKEKYWKMIYDLGVCHERLGDSAKARRVWKRLLDMKPDPKYELLLKDKLEGENEE